MNIQAAIAINPERHGFDGERPELEPPQDFKGADRKLPERENYNSDRVHWLFRHKKVDAVQNEAAQRLQMDWQISQIGGFVSSGAAIGGRSTLVPSNLPDTKCDANERVNGARDCMVAIAWRLVEMVVLENIGLEVAGKRLWGRNERGVALGALRFALDQLAKFYGLA
jgi:hypothetical protein